MGSSGSGKTHFAARLAAQRGCPHIELDALNWLPGWLERSREDFRARVADAVAADAWVLDGNYGKARDLVWARAETVIFLDYPFWLVFGRLLRRSLSRGLRRQTLWSGNQESLRLAFLSRDSILLYTLRTFRRRRDLIRAARHDPANQRLEFILFDHPRQAEAWLAGLPSL